MYCPVAELVPVRFLCAGHLGHCHHPHPHLQHQAAAASVVGVPLADYVDDGDDDDGGGGGGGVHLAVVVGREHLLLQMLNLDPGVVLVGVSRWLEC